MKRLDMQYSSTAVTSLEYKSFGKSLLYIFIDVSTCKSYVQIGEKEFPILKELY
jgi:hypothetical protein